MSVLLTVYQHITLKETYVHHRISAEDHGDNSLTTQVWCMERLSLQDTNSAFYVEFIKSLRQKQMDPTSQKAPCNISLTVEH